MLRFVLFCALLVPGSLASSKHLGFVGTYHPADPNNEDLYGFDIVAIENVWSDEGLGLQDDIKLHCQTRDVNSVWGMVIGPSEHGAFNNPNDTDLWKPVDPMGMVQAAQRWSNLSKICPQVQGIVIDDFFNNYKSNASSSQCSKCTEGPGHLYGSPISGFFCCPQALKPGAGTCPGGSACCLTPGHIKGCQGVPPCGNNPHGYTPCAALKNEFDLDQLKELKGALMGKEVDPATGRVLHHTEATTPDLQLMAVWYAPKEVELFKDDGVLGVLDAINLWIFDQTDNYKAFNNSIALLREKIGNKMPVIAGAYISDAYGDITSPGFVNPVTFKSVVEDSVKLYATGDIAGFFMFSGLSVTQLGENATLFQEWELPAFLNSTLEPVLGSGAGLVQDSHGHPLPNATVHVWFESSSPRRRTIVTRKRTDNLGSFGFTGHVGRYIISAELAGATPSNTTGVVVAGATTSFTLTLNPVLE